MATATVKIYNVEFTPADNVYVESIATYLSSLTPTYNQTVQYQKLTTDFNIKLAMPAGSSHDAQYYLNHKLGNYLEIIQESKSYYYFIMEASWLAQNTVSLRLSIDSINTFWTDIIWNPTTHITRQHKNKLKFSAYNPLTHRVTAKRIVDRYSEGITPYLVKNNIVNTIDASYNNGKKWYLIFSSDVQDEETIHPIKLTCVASEPLNIAGTRPNVVTASDLTAGYCYKGVYEFNNRCQFIAYEDDDTPHSVSVSDSECAVFYVNSDDPSKMKVEVWSTVKNSQYRPSALYSWTNITSVAFSDCNFLYTFNSYNAAVHIIEMAGKYYLTANATYTAIDTKDIEAWTGASIHSIEQVNKTDPKISKIIELPYPPFALTNPLTVPSGWSIVNGEFFYLESSSPALLCDLFTQSINNMCTFTVTGQSYKTNPAAIGFESKLYNSDYRPVNFCYGDEVWTFKRENCINQNTTSHTVAVQYKPSKDITSAAAFKFSVDSNNYKVETNYGDYLISKRDNEYPIWNSEYLNYLKYGKASEDKQRALSTAASWIGAGASVGTAVALMAFGSGTMKIVGAAISAAAAVAGACIATGQTVAAQQQKEEQLRNQAVTFSGSTDRDIFNYITNNKMQMIEYSPTTEMDNALFKLFNYTGYACNEYGVPNFTTRWWRNFVQCEAVIDISSAYEYFKDDIVQRFKNGVTYLHRRNNSYDFDWQYENYEKELVDDIDAVI